MKSIKRFFEPIFIEPGYFWRALTISLFFSLYWILNIFFIQNITSLLEVWNREKIWNIIFYFIIFNIFYFVVTFVCRHWWWAETYHYHFEKLHRIYMNKFNSLDNTYTENIWTWRIISILTKWVSTWTDLVLWTISTWSRLLISLISAWLILYNLGKIYLVVFFCSFFLLHVIIYYLNEWALKWRQWRIDTINEYDRQLVKMIMSKFEILQNDKVKKEIWVLDKYTRQAKFYNLKLNNYLFTMFSMPSLIFFIWTMGVLIMITEFKVSYASLISVFMILLILHERFIESIDYFKNFTKEIYTVQKLWKLFDDAPLLKWVYNWDDFIYERWNIDIKNVSFSYGTNKIFDDFSVQIKGWAKTAFVWISGSGKTTLVKLIAWFLSVDRWEITIDWQKLSEVNLNSYFQNIGYLTQDPSVFDWTIMENLTYWLRKDFIEKEVLDRAIKLSWCEFIYKLPCWLETEIWEKWVRLSGWQKQRLAIAKLFIKDPYIIILDEPTSALDSFSEELITDSLTKLFEWRTTLIIAHRLQTVKNADDIIVFENWKILERGDHDSLIQKNQYYKKMLDLQSWF